MDKEIEHPNRMGNLSCLLTMSDFADAAEERDKEIAISKFPKYIVNGNLRILKWKYHIRPYFVGIFPYIALT